MVNIEFNDENIQKCQCSGCPVQAESECVQDKLGKLQSQRGGTPSKEDVPGVYCSTGKAICEGLDSSQPCHCTQCEIWIENKLGEGEPGGRFCVNGEAK